MYKLIKITKDNFIIKDTDSNTIEEIPKSKLDTILKLDTKISGFELRKYAFVTDNRGIILSPTRVEKAWYKVRHNKAKLLNVNPTVIQLNREQDNTDDSTFHVGTDPGDTTGIAVIQRGRTQSKVIFKAEIHHRQDVKKKMEERRSYRRFHRQHKRYRKPRFNNRASSHRQGRVAPSIKAKKDEILRVINYLKKYIRIDFVHCEDVSFDVRALTDNYKPYNWQYQKSNRLDENIRKAVILRDNCKCKQCGVSNTRLEVHHIIPRRNNDSNLLGNLITLCSDCHQLVTGDEESYITYFQSLVGTTNLPNIKPAMHVMQGKTYLHQELSKIAPLTLTTGANTSNHRIDWNITKTHSNDACCITGIEIDNYATLVYEYTIKPRRKRTQTIQNTSNLSIRHGDLVTYKPRGRNLVTCYVIAILESGYQKGKYKLKGVKTGETFGPISVNSLHKIPINTRGLLIS